MCNAPVTPLLTAPRPNPSYPTRPDPAYKGVSYSSIVTTDAASRLMDGSAPLRRGDR